MEKKEEKNCHLLTTALLTRGPWEKFLMQYIFPSLQFLYFVLLSKYLGWPVSVIWYLRHFEGKLLNTDHRFLSNNNNHYPLGILWTIIVKNVSNYSGSHSSKFSNTDWGKARLFCPEMPILSSPEWISISNLFNLLTSLFSDQKKPISTIHV